MKSLDDHLHDFRFQNILANSIFNDVAQPILEQNESLVGEFGQHAISIAYRASYYGIGIDEAAKELGYDIMDATEWAVISAADSIKHEYFDNDMEG